MRPGSLFSDTMDGWRDDPFEASIAWLSSLPLAEASVEVYAAMLGRWLRWLEAHELPLVQVVAGDLVAYLDHHDVHSAHRQRYIRLLERLYDHLALLGHSLPNPARQVAWLGNQGGFDDETRFLSDDEYRAFVTVLHAEDERWKPRRDRAMAAAFLGAGLTVAEVCGADLTVNCIRGLDWSIPGNMARRPRVLPMAVAPMGRWLRGHAGQPLFPGTAGSPSPLDKASAWRAVRRLLVQAGIDGRRLGPQTLRNTYGALLVRSGESDEAILAFMGYRERLSVVRLRMAVTMADGRTRSPSGPSGSGDGPPAPMPGCLPPGC